MSAASMTIALMGNPNSGKTTLFNLLTGGRQHVGNYSGVTVEKREGTLKADDMTWQVVDLPGTYSLTAYTEDEVVARDFLVRNRPDGAVTVLDATNLERSLYLVVQLLELGVPVVVALNMMDEVRKNGTTIATNQLARLLDVPVVETVARTGEGRSDLLGAVKKSLDSGEVSRPHLTVSYGHDIEEALTEMVPLIREQAFLTDLYPARWTAIKYLENDEDVMAKGARAGAPHDQLLAIVDRVAAHLQTTLNTYPEAIIADSRYGYITSLLKQGVLTRNPDRESRARFSDNLDRILTNSVFGPAIMLGVIYGMFQATFVLGEIPMGWLESFFGWLGSSASAIIPDGLLQSLVVSGIIDGVGGVLGFVPLIMVMFFLLSFLEDSGYMARMAYMLDRVFRAFGLHGSSVMPMIVSGGIPGGCAVPGVMAARTLRSPKEKIATILVAPFMSCGAKVPVFLLLAAAFFPGSGAQALFWITLAGWAAALVVARVLRSTVLKGEATPFVMELPPYRLPTLRGMCIHTWERAWQYIKKAGTVILAISVLLWAAMTFPGLSSERVAAFEAERSQIEASSTMTDQAREQALLELDNRQSGESLRNSAAGRLGTALEPVTKWAGFDWRTNIALIGGFAAKEVIVSTLGTAYSLGDVDPEEAQPLSRRLASEPGWSPWTAAGLIAFVMLYAPCFVTVVTIARELSWKWASFSVVMNTVLAFGVAVGISAMG
jgi:ferrous iron transport protein B